MPNHEPVRQIMLPATSIDIGFTIQMLVRTERLDDLDLDTQFLLGHAVYGIL
jgi:hypothetical protein